MADVIARQEMSEEPEGDPVDFNLDTKRRHSTLAGFSDLVRMYRDFYLGGVFVLGHPHLSSRSVTDPIKTSSGQAISTIDTFQTQVVKRVSPYIFQHSYEERTIYEDRCSRAVYVPIIRRACDLYMGEIFSEGRITRTWPGQETGSTVKSASQRHVEDVDASGKHLDEHMLELAIWAFVEGMAIEWIDKPQLMPGESQITMSRLRAMELGLDLPIRSIIRFDDLCDRTLDRNGEAAQILFRREVENQESLLRPQQQRRASGAQYEYVYWDQEKFAIFGNEGQPITERFQIHEMGMIPANPLSFHWLRPWLGESEIANAVPIAQAILNHMSNLDEFIVFSALSLIMFECGSKDDLSRIAAGHCKLIGIPPGTQIAPSTLTPGQDPAMTMINWITHLVSQLTTILNLRMILSAGGEAASGISKEHDFRPTQKTLTRYSAALAKCENRGNWITALWMAPGASLKERMRWATANQIQASYPRSADFSLKTLREDLEDLMSLFSLSDLFPPAFWEEAVNRIVPRYLPDLDPAKLNLIKSQIATMLKKISLDAASSGRSPDIEYEDEETEEASEEEPAGETTRPGIAGVSQA